MSFALRRAGAALTVAVLGAAGVLIVAGAPAQAATARRSGSDRYATSAAVAGQFSTASTAWVVSRTDYADALSAAPAAAHQGAPLLLIGANSLPAAAAGQLKRLKPSRIVIAGGTTVVTATAEQRA